MKRILSTALILMLCILLPAAVLGEEHSAGLSRVEGRLGYMTYSQLMARYGIEDGGDDWYAPADPQPLNAYMVTGQGCMVGITRSGMYKVEEKGLVNDITKHLSTWATNIITASGGAIRFVNDPDQADLMIIATQTFPAKGLYRAGSQTVTGHSSRIELTAVKLTEPRQITSITKSNVPGQTVSINGGGNFWMYPPKFEGSSELAELVSVVMRWYGYSAHNGGKGGPVDTARQALISRGYLQGEPEAPFDDAMEAAIRQLQADYGLEETGVIDRPTLLAIYYDRECVEQNLKDYPDVI